MMAVALVVIAFIDSPQTFTQVVVIGLSNGALYALIALGYTMVYGIIELINFAHGDLFMIGSVMAAIIMEERLHQTASSPEAWGYLVLTGLAVMAIVRVVQRVSSRSSPTDVFAMRRSWLRSSPRSVSASSSRTWASSSTARRRNSRPSVLPQGSVSIGSIEIKIKYIVVICVTVPLLVLMRWIVQHTKTGKAMRATAQDRDASLLMGINVDKMISYTFALGGALAGAAGVMFVQVIGQTRYDAGFRLGLIAFTAAVLGGVGNLLGAVIGGVLIGMIQALNDSGLGLFPGQKWTQSVLFGILILMIIFRPGGIFGKNQQEKV